jgi:hypothetical protein
MTPTPPIGCPERDRPFFSASSLQPPSAVRRFRRTPSPGGTSTAKSLRGLPTAPEVGANRSLSPADQARLDELLGVKAKVAATVKPAPIVFQFALDTKGIGLCRDGSLPDDGVAVAARGYLRSILSPIDMARLDELASRVTMDERPDDGSAFALRLLRRLRRPFSEADLARVDALIARLDGEAAG